MNPNSPEDIARSVIAACADCEVCRSMLTDDCLFFRELYRLQLTHMTPFKVRHPLEVLAPPGHEGRKVCE